MCVRENIQQIPSLPSTIVFKLSPDPSFFAEAFLIRVRLVVIRGASVGFVIVIVLECLKPFYTDRTSQESVRFGLDSTSEELVVYCVVFISINQDKTASININLNI